MIYLILIFLIYFFWFIRLKLSFLSQKQQRLFFYISTFVVLALVCGLRDSSVSWDMESYMQKYEHIKEIPFSYILTHLYTDRVEIGFALINKVLGIIFPNPHTIIFFSAVLFCVIWGYYFFKNAKNDITEVIIFTCCGIYLNEFGFSRQMIAVGLLFHAFAFLTKKKYWQSVILFLISLTFHITASCFLIAYLFFLIRDKKVLVAIILSIGGILALNFGTIINFVSTFITSFSYIGRTDKTLSLGWITVVWFVEVIIAAAFLLNYFIPHKTPRVLKITDYRFSNLELCCIPAFALLYIILTYIGSRYNYIDRFGLFYIPFIIPLFINFSSFLKPKYPKLYRLYMGGLHACFVGYFLFTVTTLDHYQYSFFWS